MSFQDLSRSCLETYLTSQYEVVLQNREKSSYIAEKHILILQKYKSLISLIT